MANITSSFGEKPSRRAWNTEPQLAKGSKLSALAVPGSGSLTIYEQAVGRDASGTIVQMDDTAKAEFVGFSTDASSPLTISSTDTAGDKMLEAIDRPYAFQCLIASAAKGDEGKKVYWLYNNQVSYSAGNSGNYAGTVLGVIDSTHVLVLCPWCQGIYAGNRGLLPLGTGSHTITLTKFDINKTFTGNDSVTQTVNLPVSTKCSPGDAIHFINIGTNSITFAAQGSDTINGTGGMSTTTFASAIVETDASNNWYQY